MVSKQNGLFCLDISLQLFLIRFPALAFLYSFIKIIATSIKKRKKIYFIIHL